MKHKQMIISKNDIYSFNRYKFTLSLLLFFSILFAGLAQGYSQQKVSGNISDVNGQPLIGASVVEKGTSNGTQADFDGNYTIGNVNNDGTLVFSFLGFKNQEVLINGVSTIDIVLVEDLNKLDEVVLIGYGSQKKSDLTGAVGRVTESQLMERPVATLNQALVGKVAGVQINTTNGRPGGRTKVRIRGLSSINSDNDPLYVVDGIQLPQGKVSFAQRNIAIDYINPADISSIEVLKDASSTAIYGARGANGVILITTKKGIPGKTRVTYNSEVWFNEYGPNAIPKRLNSEQFQMVEQLAWENTQKFDPVGWANGKYASEEPSVKRSNGFLGVRANELFDANGKAILDTDWYKALRNSNRISQNHQFGFSGGSEKTRFNASIGYRDEQGLVINSYMKRHSGRFNIESQVNSWLKVGGTSEFSLRQENFQDTGQWVWEGATKYYPFLPVRYANSNSPFFPDWYKNYTNNLEYGWGTSTAGGNMYNPVLDLNERLYKVETHNYTGSFFTNISFSDDLEMKTLFSTNILNQGRKNFFPSYMNGGTNGASQYREASIFYSVENYLTYTKKIDENNSIVALLGASWQELNKSWNGGLSFRSPSDGYGVHNLGSGAFTSLASFMEAEQLNSYFTRVNYNLMDKYLFTFTARADGSSKFGASNKWAFFPSAAAAWKVSEEDFLANNTLISNLKIRGSYGETGNSSVLPYSSEAKLGPGPNMGGSAIPFYTASYGGNAATGTGLLSLENTGLRWEKVKQFDIGVELGMFDNRVNLEIDYYNRKTVDMLLNAPVPESSGFSTLIQNVGSMENKGFEMVLNTTNIDTPDFTWNSTFNITMNKNKVLSLSSPADIFNVGSPVYLGGGSIIREGEALGSMYGFTRLGVWGTDEASEAASYGLLPGDTKHKDINDDGVIDNDDRSVIGNGYADAFGTFVNYFTYKNFDLTIDIQYSIGNDLADLALHTGEDNFGSHNVYTTILNAWTPDNQNTMIPQVRNASAGFVSRFDSHMVKDASFIRGNNLILGYTFKPEALKRMKLDKLRVYASAQNFFLLVDKDIMGDPETDVANWNVSASVNPVGNVASQGFKWHEYPKASTFVLGLQIGL